MISKIFSLRNYIMKQLMKTDKSGIMQIPDKGKVDFGEMIIKEDLFRKGIDPKAITSESQLDNILNTPNVAPKSTPKKSGEVIDVDFDKGRWKDIDPEKKAGGGRTGLNYLLGEDDQNSRVPFAGGLNAARRAFLKMMGAGAAGVGAAKSGLFGLLKGGAKKEVVKELTQVPIKDISGMPAWFKPLVNKVIKEGDDVTKKFADADRQIVHKTKLPDSQTDVIVTQDITTGNVSVDIGIGKHGFADGLHGQPVRLEYKASEVIEPAFTKNKETIGKAGKTKEEFWVEEAEFTGGHPENVKFEESAFEKFGEHGSDFSEVEEFATGLKKGRGGSGHMASGGRVPMWLGGGLTKGKRTLAELLKYMSKGSSHKRSPSEMLKMINPKQFNEMLNKPEGIPSIAKEMIEKYTKEMKIDRADMIQDLIGTGRRIKKIDDDLVNYKIKIVEDMVSKGVDRKTAVQMADSIAEMASSAAGKKATPKITDQGLLEMENIQKNLATKDRKLNASGGLAGLLGE